MDKNLPSISKTAAKHFRYSCPPLAPKNQPCTASFPDEKTDEKSRTEIGVRIGGDRRVLVCGRVGLLVPTKIFNEISENGGRLPENSKPISVYGG